MSICLSHYTSGTAEAMPYPQPTFETSCSDDYQCSIPLTGGTIRLHDLSWRKALDGSEGDHA